MALTVSFVANAQGLPGGGNQVTEKTGESKHPLLDKFAGSEISYGHSASVYTFVPSGEPMYNPNWSHRITLSGQFKPIPELYIRGRLYMSQEFTKSDSTTYLNEVEFADLLFDVGYSGYKEKVTGIRFGGDVRLGLPTSKFSTLQTRVLLLAPGVNVSRSFTEGVHAFNVSYIARFGYRFNRFTTGQNSGPSIAACGDPSSPNCSAFIATGVRNPNYELLHGASASWTLFEKLSFSGSFIWGHYWLYPLADVPAEFAGSTQLQTESTNRRDITVFNLSASYQFNRQLGLSLSSYTFSPQLTQDSLRYFPLFNRNTFVSLDLSVDIEATISALL